MAHRPARRTSGFETAPESIDFFVAVKGDGEARVQELFSRLLTAEVETSRRLEKIAFSNFQPRFFRAEVQLSPDSSA